MEGTAELWRRRMWASDVRRLVVSVKGCPSRLGIAPCRSNEAKCATCRFVRWHLPRVLRKECLEVNLLRYSAGGVSVACV